jgi:hypothetical protein
MTTLIAFDPAAPKSVPEGSETSFTVRFYTAGTLTAPTSIRYRVDDVYSEDNVVDWTTVTATATATISVAASLNVMIDEDRRVERKVLTVETDNGTSTARNGSAYYDVVNIIGI